MFGIFLNMGISISGQKLQAINLTMLTENEQCFSNVDNVWLGEHGELRPII